MSLWTGVPIALRALCVNKLRSMLTMLGIIIGVGAVITMVAVGAGAQARVAEQIRNLGSNLIIVLPGAATSGGARLGHGTAPSLTEDDAEAIQRELSVVQTAAPTMRGSAQAVYGALNWSTVVLGVTPEFFEAREWDVVAGRALTPQDVNGADKVALLGHTVVQNLFGDSDPLGHVIRIRKVPFTVVGLLDTKGQSAWGQDQDDVILIPLSAARKRLFGVSPGNGRAVGAIAVKTREAGATDEAEEQVRTLLRQRHRLQPNDGDDFSLRNLSEVFQAQEESSRVLTTLLAAIASVSLLVGGIGIMNIMLVSVTERTREIGLRVAVGARSRDIKAQFLVEALTLSLIGGFIGIGLGLAGSYAVAYVADWRTLIQPGAVAVAFAFAAGVGVFFGFYPAWRASRLDPLEALRHE